MRLVLLGWLSTLLVLAAPVPERARFEGTVLITDPDTKVAPPNGSR